MAPNTCHIQTQYLPALTRNEYILSQLRYNLHRHSTIHTLELNQIKIWIVAKKCES